MKGDIKAGIDIGGTATRILIRDDVGIIATRTVPTSEFAAIEKHKRTDALVSHILSLIPPHRSLESLGIGASGPVDPIKGIINNKDTLNCFSFFPVVDELKARLGICVGIDNDAVAAVLGEYYFGSGKGQKRLLIVTLGTGIGVALLEKGKPFRTSDGQHPEAGHIKISDDPALCYCGLRGCWETAASRTWLQNHLESITPSNAFEKRDFNFYIAEASKNDRVVNVFYKYGYNLGCGLATLITLYSPDMTILSGSAAHYYHLFKAGMDQALCRTGAYASENLIIPSNLGEIGGALGATLIPTMSEFS